MPVCGLRTGAGFIAGRVAAGFAAGRCAACAGRDETLEASTLKKAILLCNSSACAASSSEVADISSEAPEFCCVTLSSCWIASLIWEAPISCSRQAAEISATSSAVLRMSGTRRFSMSPASVATCTVSPESELISLAAAWLRSASLRTSDATTAKPLPCSPARAASTAAFSARRSVWRAISCTMEIFSAMVRMATTARLTASPLASASLDD
ncbi:hypothetical protein D3C87_1551310 [compost metagenome]